MNIFKNLFNRGGGVNMSRKHKVKSDMIFTHNLLTVPLESFVADLNRLPQ